MIIILLIGVDLGSSGCKAVLYDLDGVPLASSGYDYEPYNPAPDLWEIDPLVFYDAFCHVISELSGLQVRYGRIGAIGISSHGETVIPVLCDQTALPAMMNSDNRAADEAHFIEKEIGRERLYDITGVPSHPMFSICKILNQKRKYPDIYNRVWKYLGVQDYIVLKLGFAPVSDYSIASRFMAFDIRKKRWSDEIFAAVDIDKNKFGDVICAGKSLGKINPQIAKQLNLDSAVVVSLAGHDQPCGSFGAGVMENNDSAVSCGTYECISLTGSEPLNTVKSLQYHLNSYCHVLSGKYVTLAFFPAGIAVNWVVSTFFSHERDLCEGSDMDVYDTIYASAFTDSGPTGLCMTPHIIGSCNPFWNPDAKTAIVGITPAINRFHIFKAVFEGIACELAENLQVLEEVGGKINRIRMFGGNVRKRCTAAMRSSLTGRIIELMHADQTVCRGAAMLAGIASGVFADYQDAVNTMSTLSETVFPDSKIGRLYLKQQKRYREIYAGLWGGLHE